MPPGQLINRLSYVALNPCLDSIRSMTSRRVFPSCMYNCVMKPLWLIHRASDADNGRPCSVECMLEMVAMRHALLVVEGGTGLGKATERSRFPAGHAGRGTAGCPLLYIQIRGVSRQQSAQCPVFLMPNLRGPAAVEYGVSRSNFRSGLRV